MKHLFIHIILFTLLSCNQQTDNTVILQHHIDSLQNKLNNSYKPGFGEFMSSIQAHHSKLWFAVQNKNWKLADFESQEIMEIFEDIQKYQSERKEIQMIGTINQAIDSVNQAIQNKNPESFKNSYIFLTNTCNNCHQATNFEFNVIKIPETNHFSNQDFKVSN